MSSCPCCGQEVEVLPLEGLLAAVYGSKSNQILKLIIDNYETGISSRDIETEIYGKSSYTTLNSTKVLMVRIRKLLLTYGWSIDVIADATTGQHVYKLRKT